MDNVWWVSLVGPLILASLFVWKLLPPSLLLFLGGLGVVSFIAAAIIRDRPAPLTASASDRQSALATVAALTEQVKAQEELIFAPSPEDRAALAAFLSQPDTDGSLIIAWKKLRGFSTSADNANK